MIFAHFHKGGADRYFIGSCLADIFQHVETHYHMTRANFIKTLTKQEAKDMKFPRFNKHLRLSLNPPQVINLGHPSCTANHRHRGKPQLTHA